ncbi:MAG: DUF3791 domain-containing protein [Bacteroides sp.]|nr:DUF3791 domain-containing protein [Bacteroides sp.]
MNDNKVKYTNYCISAFAKQYNMSLLEAFNYLERYGGLTFLDEYYEAEHLLSIEDAIKDLIVICQNNGGKLV